MAVKMDRGPKLCYDEQEAKQCRRSDFLGSSSGVTNSTTGRMGLFVLVSKRHTHGACLKIKCIEYVRRVRARYGEWFVERLTTPNG